jgi:hypothetical protein
MHAELTAGTGAGGPDELDREIERGSMGKRTLNWWLTLLVVHAANHTGEISAVKGIRGFKGYAL